MSDDFEKSLMAGLKLHMKKCCLFQRRVNFLGHVLTEAGVEEGCCRTELANTPKSDRAQIFRRSLCE